MKKIDLKQIGLSESESLVYTTVLKLGHCTVREISQHCGLHRPNIYDLLEQLKEKGLVSFTKQGRSMTYHVTNPHDLYHYVNEKKRYLDQVFPEILALQQQQKDDVHIEVYKGIEGMKAAFRDALREGKDIYRYGAEGLLRKNFPDFADHWLRTLKKNNQKYIGLYTTRKKLPCYYTEIRYLPKEFRNPASIMIYGDKVNINIWEPMFLAIIIESSVVSKMYKQHFDMLWNIAEK